MFEFEHFDPAQFSRRDHPVLDDATRVQFGADRVASYSLVNWGEHCTECVFPTCYKTCSFYQPRADGRCRRFAFGIAKVPSPSSWMGYAACVEFKSWSMFWTQGSATQLPTAATRLLEWTAGAAWALSGPVDWLVRKAVGFKRLSLILQSLRRHTIKRIGSWYDRFPKPDCLLVEVYNPMVTPTRLRIWIRGSSAGEQARFEWAKHAAPGFSSYEIPVADIERWIDLSAEFDMALTVADEHEKVLYVLSATFVRFASRPQPVAVSRPANTDPLKKRVKCLVWDLDYTLWDGILTESSASAAPPLREGVRSILEELDKRGILLSIASKNSEEDARKALENLGVWDLFVAPQIDWQPKSQSIKTIAEQLNIGVDALALIDDQPFERDEVARSVTGITVIPHSELRSLLDRPEFAGDASSERTARRVMYQTEVVRRDAMAKSRQGFDEFLASCDIRITIQRPDERDLPRIDDIVQRTNQLNTAGQRYSSDEVRTLLARDDRECHIVSCTDRYGSYGHVGFVVLALQDRGVLISDCMFSCRIQGKRIDEAVLAYLINQHVNAGATFVRARFVQTRRNSPAAEMLGRLEFKPDPTVPGELFITPPLAREEVDYVRIDSASIGHLSQVA